MNKNYLHIWLFPALEILTFGMALLYMDRNPWLVPLFLLLAGSFMAFTLHISAHFQVHHTSHSKIVNVIREVFYSIVLVMPFHFYRFQHIYHHLYDNDYGDLTSTWTFEGEEKKPYHFFTYCFLWPFTKKRQKEFQVLWEKDKKLVFFPKKKIIREAMLILLVALILGVINIWYGLAYIALFYIGWSLIAIVNYGQHLPVEKNNDPIGFSYVQRWYNKLLVNNGLHYEHHKDPQIPYWDLKINPDSPKNQWPQIFDAFRLLTKK